MTHSFQFDPQTILGVSPGASLREIRDAYHQKSLKYHPDKGGDEWAFRMVSRSYEILSTARVLDRAAGVPTGPAPAPPVPTPRPEPDQETWAANFSASAATPPPTSSAGIDPGSVTNVKGWGAAPPPPRDRFDHAALPRIVVAELLILRFELECSIDLFARSPEDRNLSCTLHVTWPIDELADRVRTIPDAATTLRKIGAAFQARGVRKHALTDRSDVEDGRFVGWLTYPTAVMASEALEAFREALAADGLEVEKQVREMAIPRHWS